MTTSEIKARLEYLRGELDAERISYEELHELQVLGEQGHISDDDVQLREAAGLPEFPDDGWDKMTKNMKLSDLAEETTILPGLMLERPQFVKMIQEGASREACLKYLSENF